MRIVDSEQRDLILSIAFVHIASRHERRALPLLLLVAAERSDDRDCLRALAHVYTSIGRGELALVVLDRLAEGGDEPGVMALLRARALHRSGRLDEARSCFAAFTQARTAA